MAQPRRVGVSRRHVARASLAVRNDERSASRDVASAKRETRSSGVSFEMRIDGHVAGISPDEGARSRPDLGLHHGGR